MLQFPQHTSVAQIRIARPTNSRESIVRFYCDCIGLVQVGSFSDHAGYSGVMLGLPGTEYHLEFTEHDSGDAIPPPPPDDLLVFYIPDGAERDRIASRLDAAGYHRVTPVNPYWLDLGRTYEDPDGRRIVLMNSSGI